MNIIRGIFCQWFFTALAFKVWWPFTPDAKPEVICFSLIMYALTLIYFKEDGKHD